MNLLNAVYFCCAVVVIVFELHGKVNVRNPLKKVGILLILLGAFGHILQVHGDKNMFFELGVLVYFCAAGYQSIIRKRNQRVSDHETA